jgi:lysophospholipid acyltransferase (LPLAT)-like uncharacterized protein
MKILGLTQKIERQNYKIIEDLSGSGSLLYAFWHNRQIILFNTHRNMNLCILTSSSNDGDWVANISKILGYDVVRGSTSRGGGKALVTMLKVMKKGKNIGIAIDGPRGPVYEAKSGLLYLAQKQRSPIILVAGSMKNFWQLTTWDNFMIPKPFTKIIIKYDGPFYVKHNDKIEEITKTLGSRLKKLQIDLDNEIML